MATNDIQPGLYGIQDWVMARLTAELIPLTDTQG
jgi:hypothetical protein